MSILIEDMEMPERCLECPLYDNYNYYCTLYSFGIPARHNRDGSTRPEWCELKELPKCEDAVSRAEDELISRLSDLRSRYNCFDDGERDAYHTLSEAIEALRQSSVTPKTERRWNPCDWCVYNPPSSMDGKPCTLCPAVANPE